MEDQKVEGERDEEGWIPSANNLPPFFEKRGQSFRKRREMREKNGLFLAPFLRAFSTFSKWKKERLLNQIQRTRFHFVVGDIEKKKLFSDMQNKRRTFFKFGYSFSLYSMYLFRKYRSFLRVQKSKGKEEEGGNFLIRPLTRKRGRTVTPPWLLPLSGGEGGRENDEKEEKGARGV